MQMGNAFRTAALVKDTGEAVGGVVVARTGENTKQVIDRVKQKILELQPGLPPGVRIVPFYDRSELIEATVDTLRHALIEEVILVTLAHIVFLMHFRSILVVTLPLPLAVLCSFLLMHYTHITSNVMSLAGIAIAIGVLVDAGIVVTENAFRHLEGVDTRDRGLVLETILRATKLVGRPTFFSMAIIVLAFVPVFALTGQEGKLFHPLAFAKTFAMASATAISLTLIPILCTLLLRGGFHSEDRNPVMRFLQWLYRPALRWALDHRMITLTAALVLFGGAVVLASGIGSEFMPPLNEGDIMFMPIADPSISLAQNTEYAKRQDAVLKRFPEVAYVAAKVARAETSTDPAGLNMTETIVHLKPLDQWPRGMTLAKLKSEMDRAVSLPGVANIWTQPIVNRIDMLTTGIRSEIGVKLFGSDLIVLEGKAREIADAVRTVRGASDIYPEQVTGGLYLDIRPNREAAARYGIDIGEVQNVIETAIGENNITTTIEGRKRFPVRVRYAPQFRRDPRELGNVLVSGANGAQIPLAQLADIRQVSGPSAINSENGLLEVSVLLNARGRDPGSVIADAEKAIQRTVKLPAGYYYNWSGQFESEVRAKDRLRIVMPDRDWRHLHSAVPYLSLVPGGCSRTAGGALRAYRRALSAVAARLQFLGRRVGWFHRSVRHRGADDGSDGDLPRRSGGAKAARTRDAQRHRSAGGGDGRRFASPAAQGDDGFNGGRGPAANFLEPSRRLGGDTPPGDPGSRRHGQLACPCADRHTGRLPVAARARAPA